MNKFHRFVTQEKGGIAIMLALILPFIISCFALAFDGARLMTKNARLADSIHEAGLIIATASSTMPDTAEKIRLETLLARYISSHMPNEDITNASLNITLIDDDETGLKLPLFDIQANIDVNTLLPINIAPAFAPTLNMANQGAVRKGRPKIEETGEPADFVFVLDFSGSMYEPSAEPGMSRINLLKKVVKDITEAALDAYPDATFSLVPFDVGVSVRLPGENELGGAINGCSVLMVPRKSINSSLNMKTGYEINYEFWANQMMARSGTNGLQTIPNVSLNAGSLPANYMIAVNRALDQGRYNYYNRYVVPSVVRSITTVSNTTQAWQWLVNQGWCKQNSNAEQNAGRAPYSCEKDPSKSIFTAENQALIRSEILAYRNVVNLFGATGGNGGIFRLAAIDINATLDGMFDSSNIITIPLDYRERGQRANFSFGDMCQSSGHATQWYPLGNSNALPASAQVNRLAEVRHNAYLIEPTNDLAVLAEFQNMLPLGGTESTSALLRAVPELVKGTNPRKALVVISDGADNEESILYAFHNQRPAGDRVCDRIRNKLKDHNPTAESVDIYFISVVDDKAEKDSEKRTKYWGDYCTGPENAVIATRYSDIMDMLIKVVNSTITYEETGYIHNR